MQTFSKFTILDFLANPIFMKKKYFLKLFFFAMLLASTATYAQSNDGVTQKSSIENIEGLNIFPNPVSNGKVYINTKYNLTKTIEIYDVLGKKIISQILIIIQYLLII